VSLLRKPLITRLMDAVQKERREREIAEVLTRFRIFAERSKWKKARISRELGVSVSTVDRWLAGQDRILLASMLAIRRFLEEWD
jgi:transcriptional regulator with XRE-family HTH domain